MYQGILRRAATASHYVSNGRHALRSKPGITLQQLRSLSVLKSCDNQTRSRQGSRYWPVELRVPHTKHLTHQRKDHFSSNPATNSLIKGGIVSSPLPDLEIATEEPLAHFMLKEFDAYGESTAIINGVTGQKYSYRELKEGAIRTASALSRLGLVKGDVLTVVAPNSPEWIIFYLGAAAVGIIVSSVNPLYLAGELAHALSNSHSKYIVTIPELVGVAKAAKVNCPDVKEIIVFGEADGCRPFSGLLQDDGKAFPENVQFTPTEDMVALPYSSGTTGLPKGVMLSHTNLVSNVQQIRAPDVLEYGQGDTLMCVLPLFHIYGQVVIMLSGLKGGSTIVTLPKFDPQLFLQSASTYKTNYLHVVPPIVLFLAKHPLVGQFDLSCVQTMFVGAAPCPEEPMREAVLKVNKAASFRQGYGLTEASPVTHCNVTDPAKVKYHTIGPSVPNTDYKIVDVESGAILGQGEEGELCVRGPQVMLGYFKNQEATEHTLKDGFLHTGDIGYYDEDCHVIISDRLKELIKFKGFQVAPAELEALLVAHPAIQEAAVIGKPDEKAGELPRAYVVIKPDMQITAEEVQEYIKDKVAPFKQLSGGVQFRDEIPKSASGKLLRRFLKDELLKDM